MMKMNVEVISKENIKPSSPTPNHLKTFNLSFFDLLGPPVYTPLIYFYTNSSLFGEDQDSKIQKFDCLRKSLSAVLTLYYPFAGRLRDGVIIDCNDSGVDLFKATATNCNLSDIISNPEGEVLKQLLPFDTSSIANIGYGSGLRALLAIQVNYFNCGGTAISVCLSHKVADGACVTTFMKAWAAMARGAPAKDVRPNFDIGTLFPPKDTTVYDSNSGITTEKIITKRYVFEAAHIDFLRVKLKSSLGYPTRVEAVSAFIWNRFEDVAQANGGKNAKQYVIVHAVNCRGRMVPPLPESSLGNMVALAVVPAHIAQKNCSKVSQLRDAIWKFDIKYLKEMQRSGAQYLNSVGVEAKKVYKGDVELLPFTSLCRFPLYDTDFGWGKPIWVCTTTVACKNATFLLGTRTGSGIEAWVNLLEADIAPFERGLKLSGLFALSKL